MVLRKRLKIIQSATAAHACRCIRSCSIFALALLWLPWAQSAVPGIQCPDGKPADGIERAGNARHCLLIRKFEPDSASMNSRVLVAFLNGDSRGSIELPAAGGAAFNLSQQLHASTVALQRPGYRSSPDLSGGTAGLEDDDYTAGNVAIVASALERLRTLNPDKKILLIGHSGGAAMAALLAGRFPASADAYLLAGCPCDLVSWRQWRSTSAGQAIPWTHSLSPLNEVARIRAGTRISLVVGSRDDNTLAKFSEAYVVGLHTQGIKTRVTYAVGATHVSVLRSPEFFMLAQELVQELSR
ncbi:hypothetical protein BH10PSE16_BH10PSE16_16110 [soil metagenome]